MTEKQTMAGEILRMIENVSPDDAAGLDEIDARVNCYIGRYEFLGMMPKVHPDAIFYKTNDPEGGLPEIENISSNFYTRDRNLLKAIRPEGWYFNIGNTETISGPVPWCDARKYTVAECMQSGRMPTEELAELHSIIQAITHERSRL